MSSRIHSRGKKILDLCTSNEDQEITKESEPSTSGFTPISEVSLVQNVEFEYIGLSEPVSDNFNSDTNLFSFIEDEQNDNIQLEDTVSFLHLKAPSPNLTIASSTITTEVQSTFPDNSIAGNTDSNIPSSSNKIPPPIEDLISDESMQDGLVPYKINSDSESDYDSYPEKSKKRKKRVQIQKSNWFAEKNRKLRESGKKYYGRKKEEKWNYEVPRKPRVMENRCGCKETKTGSLKCSIFTEVDRQNIFKDFWSMSWPEKKVYVNNLVTSLPVKRPRGRASDRESKRAQSLFYYLKKEDQPLKVCRTMFLKTLGIGRWTVLNWKNKQVPVSNKKNNKHLDSDKTKKSYSKPFELERQELKNFFESLPAVESHYCRANTEKKYLLPEWRSKRSLYDFYVKDWCKMRNVRALSICKFYEEFDIQNLGLYSPKKDQCETCALFKVGNKTQEDYLEHQSKKEEARAEKEKDKAEESVVFTVDLQAVLMAPKSKISSLYYRTKLQVHNLTFYNLINKDGYCYLWNETEGGVNSEEFASIWVSLIEKVLGQNEQEKPNKIIFYSDGCTYQNRNCVMSNALLMTAINHNVIIEQKFLEVGHTQMEADSIHSSVERALKDKNINVPAEYISICRLARKNPKPYDVTYLNHNFFKNFDDVSFYKSIRPGRGKGDAKVTDIRGLKYTANGEVFFKLRFTEEWQALPQRKCPAVVALPYSSLKNLFASKRKISKRKFDDLQYLKNTLPEDYRHFYDNLPHE